ncbi:hypothetical protein [Mycobacterium paragordonae]|uniref:Uncharacterized protein n=1 Tax=Mycobacterium paragordonae TaxID=1389713 RepID=A0ABQ1CER3_9MYCO|nr:hypothetical protein [Mycobacterium paragordonae]PJE19548.1 MAG: hypothetical protein CK431_31760 [Mycobacterium sp.]GFG82956.1 hypothetical protein MPRG_62320 [Mycobacterium paragordonae]
MSGEVDPVMQEFADLVIDRLMARGCTLFPGAEPAVALATTDSAAAVPAGGALADTVAGAQGELARVQSSVRGADEASAQVVAAAGQVGVDARREAELLREQARAQVSAILPVTNSAAGMRLLVSVLDERLGDLQGRVEAVREANSAAAEQLRELARGYGQQSV